MFQTTHQIGLFAVPYTLLQLSPVVQFQSARFHHLLQLEPKIAVGTSTVDFWATPSFEEYSTGNVLANIGSILPLYHDFFFTTPLN